MIRVALKNLAGRKLRAALTAIAIVLGVAMVSGTYVLTDTIQRAFDNIFESTYKGTDAVITGKTAFESGGLEGEASDVSFPASVLEEVRGLPAVEAAIGGVADEATQLIDRDGEPITSGGAPNLGFSINRDPRFEALTLVDGDWPEGWGQVAIDRATADREEYEVGDPIGVAAQGPVQRFRVVGIVELGAVASIGGATLAAFDLATAQRLFDKEGQLDQIRVAKKEDVSTADLMGQIREALPPTAQARLAGQQAEEDAEETTEFIGFLQNFLLAFGGIALFVGSFVIANTLSITIAQRTRELATMRTIGASRKQLLWSVVLEALVLGALASATGLFLGLGLAKLLNTLFVEFGIDLPQAALVFAPRTIAVSLVAGVLVTLLASLRPAIRATRVPPIAAVREGAILPVTRFARLRAAGALVLTGVGFALVLFGLFKDGLSTLTILLSMGVGALAVFFGVALFAPKLVRPLAFVLGWPGARAGGAAGELARGNAARNPARTAQTASALMIGLALVTLVAVLGQGILKSFTDSVDELFLADYAVRTENFSPMPIRVEEALEGVPGVEGVAGIRFDQARVFGESSDVGAADADLARAVEIPWKDGSQEVFRDLGPGDAFVRDTTAEEHDLTVGSPIELLTPSGKRVRVTVRGIFDEPAGGSPFAAINISSQDFDANWPQPQDDFVFVNVADGVTPANTDRLERSIDPFPAAKLETREQFKDSFVGELSTVLNILYVLLALSIVVSLFGIVNTLVLTVFERTRELGMLRAIGMTRRQVRRMIRHESVVTALIGAALGIALGIVLGALLVARVDFIVFSLPVQSIVIFVLASILIGILAAIFPARRAARLRILEALQYE